MTSDRFSATRRELLKLGAIGAAGALLPRLAFGAALARDERPREISFYNLHTGESLRTVYWADGGYVPDALSGVDHVLRDFRTGDVHPIEPRLLDLLHRLAGTLDSREPFHVISGYRSPATNAMLRAESGGVASHSLHLQGWAADVRVPGRRLIDLREAALALRGGGVGYYPASDFVHVDVGRVRFW